MFDKEKCCFNRIYVGLIGDLCCFNGIYFEISPTKADDWFGNTIVLYHRLNLHRFYAAKWMRMVYISAWFRGFEHGFRTWALIDCIQDTFRFNHKECRYNNWYWYNMVFNGTNWEFMELVWQISLMERAHWMFLGEVKPPTGVIHDPLHCGCCAFIRGPLPTHVLPSYERCSWQLTIRLKYARGVRWFTHSTPAFMWAVPRDVLVVPDSTKRTWSRNLDSGLTEKLT